MSDAEQHSDAPKKARGKPFEKGNPGRPPGARNRTTVALEGMLDRNGELILQKVLDLALAGDRAMLKLCFERLVGPRAEPSIPFDMPPIKSPADAPAAMSAIMEAVTAADINLAQAMQASALVQETVAAFTVAELELRLKRLEELAKQQ